MRVHFLAHLPHLAAELKASGVIKRVTSLAGTGGRNNCACA